MDWHMIATGVRKRKFRPRNAEQSGGNAGCYHGAAQHTEDGHASDMRSRPTIRPAAPSASCDQKKPAVAPIKTLSVRAQNVLKELALELTGEQPPRGTWAPSRELLLALTMERLEAARNCGPRTAREIITWAHNCGVTIKPPIQVGRSLSEMWAQLASDASKGALTSAEVIAALQRSIRRKSARIPVAFQIILLKILISTFE